MSMKKKIYKTTQDRDTYPDGYTFELLDDLKLDPSQVDLTLDELYSARRYLEQKFKEDKQNMESDWRTNLRADHEQVDFLAKGRDTRVSSV